MPHATTTAVTYPDVFQVYYGSKVCRDVSCCSSEAMTDNKRARDVYNRYLHSPWLCLNDYIFTTNNDGSIRLDEGKMDC